MNRESNADYQSAHPEKRLLCSPNCSTVSSNIVQALLHVASNSSITLQAQMAQQELQSLFRKLSTPVVSAHTYQYLWIQHPVTAACTMLYAHSYVVSLPHNTTASIVKHWMIAKASSAMCSPGKRLKGRPSRQNLYRLFSAAQHICCQIAPMVCLWQT